MQEMTSTAWKRNGSSIVWSPVLLADLIRNVEATSLRTLIDWLRTGFPENPPGGGSAVLIGGLQTVVETMMQRETPEAVGAWLREHALAAVRLWKSHWPNVAMIFVMDGPVALFEFNLADEIVYFGKGRDRNKKVRLSQAIWNGATSGVGAFQLIVPETEDVGGYFVRWLS